MVRSACVETNIMKITMWALSALVDLFSELRKKEITLSPRGSLCHSCCFLHFSLPHVSFSLGLSPICRHVFRIVGVVFASQLCAENMGFSEKNSFMLSTKILFEKLVLLLFGWHCPRHLFTSHNSSSQICSALLNLYNFLKLSEPKGNQEVFKIIWVYLHGVL